MTESMSGTQQRPLHGPLSVPYTQVHAPGAPESDGGDR